MALRARVVMGAAPSLGSSSPRTGVFFSALLQFYTRPRFSLPPFSREQCVRTGHQKWEAVPGRAVGLREDVFVLSGLPAQLPSTPPLAQQSPPCVAVRPLRVSSSVASG